MKNIMNQVKKMTKTLNIILVLAITVLITSFVVMAVSLQKKADLVLSQYSIRREELATKQQQIQDIVLTLNSTLQMELENQRTIAEQIDTTLKNINATAINKTNITASAPTKANTTVISVTPKPVRVITRAS
jgi:hypothetical protein